tara:strand:- start:178 stop:459 length:282 start_codon:yes stop_codon:yes gene_type:complete
MVMNSKEKIKNLRFKAEELSNRIACGDGEIMHMMDDWYDTIRLLEHFSEHKGLIALCGGDLPLIEDYIDKECILLVPEKYYSSASRGMMPHPD